MSEDKTPKLSPQTQSLIEALTKLADVEFSKIDLKAELEDIKRTIEAPLEWQRPLGQPTEEP